LSAARLAEMAESCSADGRLKVERYRVRLNGQRSPSLGFGA
jgi:hypothetical protein